MYSGIETSSNLSRVFEPFLIIELVSCRKMDIHLCYRIRVGRESLTVQSIILLENG